MSVAYSAPLPLLSLRRAAKTQRRAALEAAIEAALQALDDLDGDPDLELTCEDEGAQCDDDGVCGSLDPDNEPTLGSQDDGPGGSRWNWISHDWSCGEGEPDDRPRGALRAAQLRYRVRSATRSTGSPRYMAKALSVAQREG